MSDAPCACLDEPLPFDDYDLVRHMGIDKTNGRFGEVNTWRCRRCGRLWLHYLVEYEGFSHSARYFMGLITFERAETLSPDEAVDYLNQLDWHHYGGSYFGRKGRALGPVDPDL